jgi:hypothetical protein
MGGDRSSVVVWLVVLVSAVVLAALGNSEGDVSLLAVVLATGSLLSISLRNRALSNTLRRAFVAAFALAFAVAFVAAHTTGTRTESVLHLAGTLALELLVLVMALAVEFRHWRGLERVAALLGTEAAGYANVVDVSEAAPAMMAQFARSARYGEPLTVVVLERDSRRAGPGTEPFVDALDRVGPGVIEHLSRLFARTQVCALISETARRSDLVVTDSDSRVVVVSAATAEVGAQRFAERILHASETKLGIPLVAGIATCPADGATLESLITSAQRRSCPVEEIGAPVERPRASEGINMPQLQMPTPLIGTET